MQLGFESGHSPLSDDKVRNDEAVCHFPHTIFMACLYVPQHLFPSSLCDSILLCHVHYGLGHVAQMGLLSGQINKSVG